jgi:DNA polymerase-3 subunit alpha
VRSKDDLIFREKELLGLFVTGHPLDPHLRSLKQIGCLTLGEALLLEDGAVFRMAFVVESVEIKTSTKTQKKFAIIRVSDTGEEVLEFPVWSDMYDEHLSSLHENALLWGVFSKERRQDEVQFSLKFLSEIRTISPETIEQGDKAYDKAKEFLRKPYQTKEPKESPKKGEVPQKSLVSVTLDLTKFRASHALHLSKILEKHPGDARFEVSFKKDEEEVALLRLPQSRSSSCSVSCLKEIEKIPSWIGTETKFIESPKK